ncbi:MAG: restriction endonuclease [Candidatus Gastranaerophilales bacterium]|nr:restriction endonuclease [Candidatus Gastranaerophilales bacterium]
MAIPDFQTLMLPVLQNLNDNKEKTTVELAQLLADQIQLSEEDRVQLYPHSHQKIFKDRISWALLYLSKANLVNRPQRGFYKISEIGQKVLRSNPEVINNKYLKQFNLDVVNPKKKDNHEMTESSQTPDEMIAKAQELYSKNLQSELLSKLKTVDPIRFEQIVLDLMEKMNYGIGQMTKISHDGGIDGIIDEDELGLGKIYLQAKRYSDNKVNEKEMQNFVGALGCSTVRKGVFITTSFFDERAKRKAESVQGKILRLIDGQELTKLMIKHNVGVQTKTKIEIKKLDEDFF